MSSDGQKTCSQCGAPFTCGVKSGSERCWCMDFPQVLPVSDKEDCLCPACLETRIQQSTPPKSVAVPG